MKFTDDLYVLDYGGKKVYFGDDPIKYQEIVLGKNFNWFEKLRLTLHYKIGKLFW